MPLVGVGRQGEEGGADFKDFEIWTTHFGELRRVVEGRRRGWGFAGWWCDDVEDSQIAGGDTSAIIVPSTLLSIRRGEQLRHHSRRHMFTSHQALLNYTA